MSWICTQYLKRSLKADWSGLLEALLNHTWNGAFNRSSEHHEGASWYSASKGAIPYLHPIEKWEEATNQNETFALTVPWQPASLNVGELMECILMEQVHRKKSRSPFSLVKDKEIKSPSLVIRFMNFVQKTNAPKPKNKTQKTLNLKMEKP